MLFLDTFGGVFFTFEAFLLDPNRIKGEYAFSNDVCWRR